MYRSDLDFNEKYSRSFKNISNLIYVLSSKKQTLDDAYAAPANFLEIDVINPITHGIGNKRYTDYECRLKVSLSYKGLQFSVYYLTKCFHCSFPDLDPLGFVPVITYLVPYQGSRYEIINIGSGSSTFSPKTWKFR